jgi:lysyl-tRNA synthetase class II
MTPLTKLNALCNKWPKKTQVIDEAMHYDADYVRALEYGLPPTAGEGIGIGPFGYVVYELSVYS